MNTITVSEKVKKCIDLVKIIDLSDLNLLEKQIVSMSKDLTNNNDNIQSLNQLLVKTMVLTGAESGTIYLLKRKRIAFFIGI